MKKRVFAYYESLQSVDQPEEFSCSNLWKQSWERQGWECVMLNNSHAKGSSLHLKMVKKLMELSNSLPPELAGEFPKIMARFIRWCALHAAGGGWMSDYDVANINFPASIAQQHEETGTLQVITGEPAWLFYATPGHCSAAINKFLNENLVEGTRLRTESEILGCEDRLRFVKDLLFHARKTPNRKRSNEMRDLTEL
jgi:hypothetical protein